MSNSILNSIQKGAQVFNTLPQKTGLSITDIFGFNPETDPFVFINEDGSRPSGSKNTIDPSTNFDGKCVSILSNSPLATILREMPQMKHFDDKPLYFYSQALPNWTLCAWLNDDELYCLDFFLASKAVIQVANASLLLCVDTDIVQINKDATLLVKVGEFAAPYDKYILLDYLQDYKQVTAPSVFA